MHQYLIDKMVNAVMESLALPAGQRPAVRSALQRCWEDKIALVWGVDDVIPECQGLTREEAVEVLQAVLRRHDASVGVNWDTLQTVALELYGERAIDDGEEQP